MYRTTASLAIFWLVVALVGVPLCILPAAATGGFPPREALRRMKPAPGFAVELVASEPEVRQPVTMSFDGRGRLWVIQYLQYPNPAGLKVVKSDRYLRTTYDRVPDPPPRGPRGADRITICEDSDGDGLMDKFKDFVGGLNLASGMALAPDGVYVLQTPYLLFYPDRNHDDIPDGDPEVLLTGFGMEDAHAVANSLTWGPDGWLYGAQGSTVTARIRGLTFQQGVWRYHPKTKRFELFAEGGGNTWGVDFDARGNLFAGTNWGGHAMLHMVQGGYYIKGFEKHGPLQNPFAFGYFDHVPYKDFRGGHVTCGGIVYQGGAFPKEFDGCYIAANLLSNAIHWHKLIPNKSTFKAQFGGELLVADDPCFRPIDCTVGPDGAVYVADWYDKRANHVDPVDDWDKSTGRIYRIASKSNPTKAAPIDLDHASTSQLIQCLVSPNSFIRTESRVRLWSRDDVNLNAQLRRFVKPGNEQVSERQRLEALWTLAGRSALGPKELAGFLNDSSGSVRAWAVRLLGDSDNVDESLASQLAQTTSNESDPTVLCQMAATSKRLRCERRPFLQRLVYADESDPFIPLQTWWAIEAGADRNREKDVPWIVSQWKLPLVRNFLVSRLARRFAAKGTPEDWRACSELLAGAPDPGEFDRVLSAIEAGTTGRSFVAAPEAIAGQLAVRFAEPPLTLPLLQLGLRFHLKNATSVARAAIVGARLSDVDKSALVASLGRDGGPQATAVLCELLDRSLSPTVQQSVVTTLERFPDDAIAKRIVTLFAVGSGRIRSQIVTTLCVRASWARQLLDAVDAKVIPVAAIGDADLQKISAFGDPALNARLEKRWGKIKPPSPGEVRARIHGVCVTIRMAKGNRDRGQLLFKENCAICHKLFGDGNAVGPELTGIDRKNLEFLVANVVEPSAVIRKEYTAHIVATTDGRILTGLIAEQSADAVTLLDSKNQKVVVPRSEIESIRASDVSLMPEKLLDKLDHQQIRDLFAYLQSNPVGVAK